MKKVTSQTGIELTKRFEGCRLIAYQDAIGVWTIGYGHTKNVHAGMKITQEKAVELLKSDLADSEYNVNRFDKKYSWNQNEFDALVSFAFNIGSIDKLTANGTRSRSIIAEKILLYNRANGKELPGLTVRRKAEQELFLEGSLDIETSLESTAGLSISEIKFNITIVQKWLNKEYKDYIKKCKRTNYKLLVEDGIKGNKTRTALTIALQIYLNSLGENLTVDGDYGAKTNYAVKKRIAVKEGTKDISAKIVQAILYLYGYNPQVFREEFTKDCMTALKLCQSDHNLNADGIAGIIFFTTFLKQRQ